MDAGNHSFRYEIFLTSCVTQVILVCHSNYWQVESNSTYYFPVTVCKTYSTFCLLTMPCPMFPFSKNMTWQNDQGAFKLIWFPLSSQNLLASFSFQGSWIENSTYYLSSGVFIPQEEKSLHAQSHSALQQYFSVLFLACKWHIYISLQTLIHLLLNIVVN
jgi:hypothetical protein